MNESGEDTQRGATRTTVSRLRRQPGETTGDWIRRTRRQTVPHLQGEPLMISLAVAVGLGTGLLAAALIGVIAVVQRVAFGTHASWPLVLLVPTVGALVVGLIVTYVAPESSGSGVIQVMTTVATHGGRFRGRVPFAGVAASGIALGTGASGGREGPIVLIGGSVGSLLGRLFAVGEERMRTLVAAGAAAGIGASFNAPIGGMLFAIELIIGRFRASVLQAVVVASVVGSVTTREIIGPGIIYEPATLYTFSDARELGLYAVLGVAAALFGIAFLYGEDLAKRVFARLQIWRPLKLGLGGLGVGLIALAVPEVLGTGDNLPPIDGIRDPIQRMLDAEIGASYAAVGLLLILAFAKLVATCLSIGSGNAVGTFAPTIFCGAAVGGAVGHVAAELLPDAGVQPGAFALVGMAAVFAAAARAPLTAIVIAFELTSDYELVLPLMLAAGLATFIADRIQPESVYTWPLAKRGIVYGEPEDVDLMQTVRVSEVMTTDPDMLTADMTLPEARAEFRRTGHHGFPVLDADRRLVGVCTLTDVAVGDAGDDGLTVGQVCTHQMLTVTPQDPVFLALRRMAMIDVGRLPVVAAHDHRQLVGLIRRSDLVTAYRQAVTRSLVSQHRTELRRLRDLVGTNFVEVRVTDASPATGRQIRSVAWPRHTLLTSVHRDGDLILPDGSTELRPGDRVSAIVDDDHLPEVRQLLTGSADPGTTEES
ncbi:MAG TPA: chloride channel protein [Euzebyales bacterium]|nr:chloride channel protein [Euzebyales bacterium]